MEEVRPGGRSGAESGQHPNPRDAIVAGGVAVNQYEDLLVDALLDRGFSVEEAERLIALQDRVERERLEDEERRVFAQWLARLMSEEH